jgi:glycosyltransferase involved in cell wall biosynthesis
VADEDRPGVRIGFYSDSRAIGGAETSLRNLLAALSPWVDAVAVGVDADVVRWVAGGRPACTTVVLPPIGSKRDIGAFRAHLRAFRRLRPRILHINLSDPWSSHWAILAAIATPGVRVIAVEQSTWRTRSLRRRVLKRLLVRGVAAEVAVGTASADAAAAFTGLPRERIRVIHNGVPDLEVTPFPRSTPVPTVGAVGRLEHEKGFDVLLKALASVPDAVVVLVGDGRCRQELVDLAGRLELGDRVHFVGWSDEPRRHLPTFDLCAVPSRIEAFPLIVVEAMLAGLPIVASNVGSVEDAVVEGETGRLVRPEDPDQLASTLRSLLADPERMQEMGRKGRVHARRRFTADAMAAAFESLYTELLE